MAFEPPVAVYDACVLYPFHLRNLLVQCAVDRLVEARWTDQIHDEWIRNLSTGNPELPVRLLFAARDLMKAALPSATVTGYEAVIPSITLPDLDDRHVVAAAVTARASIVVTWNVRDFPAAELQKHGLVRQTPDVFLTNLFGQMPDATIQAAKGARRNLRRSKVPAKEFVDVLRRQRLVRFTSAIGPYLSRL
jgi:hypothetical protein